MSLNCEPKKPTPSYLARSIQQTYRDIGMSPVFNVNNTVSPCVEDFTSPTYYMSGTTKPITGLTITSIGVYNLSEIDNFDIGFNFTGSTDYTGYTGQFCYKMIPVLNSAPIEDKCTNYSDITGSSVTYNFTTTEISSLDNEYFIRPYDRFKSKCYTDRRGRTGFTIDTSNFTPIDFSRDDYMVTVVNPPQPVLELISSNVFFNLQFVNEELSAPEGAGQFLLSSKPVGGQAVISVNGIAMSPNDYTLDTNTGLVTFISGITLESTDVIQAYYNKTTATGGDEVRVQQNVKLDIFNITGITVDFVSNFSATTYENIVNYNSTNNRYEIFLTDRIDTNIQPTLTLNGTSLVFNVDFFKSNIVENKLILREGLVPQVGEIVSVFYYYSGLNRPGDLGVLYTDTPTFSWSTQTNITKTLLSYGNFTVEIAGVDDPEFNTILNTGTTVYNNNSDSYTLEVGPITTTSIRDYIYRIRFDKYYATTAVKNLYKTTSYSDTGSFRLNWNYISNSNF